MSLIDHLDYCRLTLDVNERTVQTKPADEVDDILPSRQQELKYTNDKIFSLNSSKDSEKHCIICDKYFSTRFTLNRHLHTQHNVKVNCSNRLLQCPVGGCNQCFNFMDIVRTHLRGFHKIEIRNGTMLKFQTFEMFLRWKAEEEKRTYTKFVRPHGKYKRNDGAEVHQFYCHRSGYYHPEGKGLKKLKSQGSCKMGSACPATITAFKLNSNEVDCKYFSTHVGHITDREELYFSSEERSRVNELLANNTSFASVLDSVKDWQSQELEHLADIRRQYNLKIKKYGDQWNQIQSLKTASNENFTNFITNLTMLDAEKFIVCARLPLRTDGEEIFDVDNPLILIVISSFQAFALKKYANDGFVCVSSTFDPQRRNLFLTTVYTLNETMQVIPCAFCLSNKLDEEIYVELIESIKTKAGLVRPKYLLADDKHLLQEVWARAMGPLNNFFLCSWFVDRDWRKHLCKIIGKPYQKVGFYKALRVLLKESDRSKFSVLSTSLMRCLKSKSTESFGTYMENEWMSQLEKWSFAYRDTDCAIFDSRLEPIHFSFNQLCSSQNNYSLDIILYVMLRISRDYVNLKPGLCAEQNNWVLAMIKSSSQSCLVNNFKNLLFMNCGKWIVQTSQGDFVVLKCEDQCVNENECWLKCESCNVCIHCFSCSCASNFLQGIICEHIHLVGRYLIEPDVNKADEFILETVNTRQEFANDMLMQIDIPKLTADDIVFEITSLSQQIAYKAKGISDVSTLQCLKDNLKLILCTSSP